MTDASHDRLTAEYVREVWASLGSIVMPTLLLHSSALDEAVGAHVTLACETFQRTGSFKFRGAYNLLRSVSAERIVSASSGNFGQAVALAARMLGKHCTVVMPNTSARVKIEAVRRNCAEVDLIDTATVRRLDRVQEVMEQQPGSFYAPAFDDLRVVAGNSSLGRDVLAQVADLGALLVPVGGGGLISGIVTARDVLGSRTRIVGAEPAIANDAARSFRSGTLIANDEEPPTIADGARTLSLGAVTWPIVQRGVDEIVEVPEATIAHATRLLFRTANVKAEPTGALALGAALVCRERFAGQRIGCIVSGGNVDADVYAAILREEL
ncbi:MAG TPA: threonine/serine dehydratase [Chloroflexota bacterium]|nr:threonine/serine dehydratase [Chloroflexota bacterium]